MFPAVADAQNTHCGQLDQYTVQQENLHFIEFKSYDCLSAVGMKG